MKSIIKTLLIIALLLATIIILFCRDTKTKSKEDFCIFGFLGNTCSTNNNTPAPAPPAADTEPDTTYKVKSE